MEDYNYDDDMPWYSHVGKITSVVIGNGVTSIGNGTFRGCTGLTSVTIGDGVTSIGNIAFYDCTSLASVTIGSGVTSIGLLAFGDCNNLTKSGTTILRLPMIVGMAETGINSRA